MEQRPGDLDRAEAGAQRRLIELAPETVAAAFQRRERLRQFRLRQAAGQGERGHAVARPHRAEPDQRVVLRQAPAGGIDPLVVDHPGEAARLRDDPRALSGHVVELVAESEALRIDLDAAFDQQPGIEVDAVRLRQQAQPLIGIHVAERGAHRLPPADRVAGILLPAEITRVAHRRNMSRHHRPVGAEAAARQHQGAAGHHRRSTVRAPVAHRLHPAVGRGIEVGHVRLGQHHRARLLRGVLQPGHQRLAGPLRHAVHAARGMTECRTPGQVDRDRHGVARRQPVQRRAALPRHRARQHRIRAIVGLAHDVGQEAGRIILDAVVRLGSAAGGA